MHIVVVSDHFYPEISTLSTRVKELAQFWVQQGHTVTILTAFPSHPFGVLYEGYQKKIFQLEKINNINVIRIWTFFSPKKNALYRGLNYLSFAILGSLLGLFLIKKPDVIIGTSPRPCNPFIAKLLAQWKKAKFVFEVRDLWPEIITEMKILPRKNMAVKILYKLVGYWYRKADLIVPLTDGFVDKIKQYPGVDSKKIFVVKNGADLHLNHQNNLNQEEWIRKKYNVPQGKILISFIGTIGLAQGLEVLPKIAHFIKEQKLPVFFAVMGDGVDKIKLARLIAEFQLDNILLIPAQKREEALKLLAISDLSFVHLKPIDFFNTTIPSKIFEAMVSSIPLLAGVTGESGELIKKASCGFVFEPGNAEQATEKIKEFLTLTDFEKKQLGICCLNYLKKYHDREQLAKEYLQALLGLKNKDLTTCI